MKKRVLHIVWGLGIGGIETMLVNIANAQIKLGTDVHVLIVNNLYDKLLIDAFDSVVNLHMMKRKLGDKNPFFVVKFNRLIKNINPDVIHLHDGSICSLLSKKNQKRNLCVTMHAMPTAYQSVVNGGQNFISRLLYGADIMKRYAKIPTVFSISQVVHDELLEKFGIDSFVVNNGVPTDSFLCREDKLPSEPIKVVMVGRLDYKVKGQDLIIESLSKCASKIIVDFIGDYNGPKTSKAKDYLTELASSHGVIDRVSFLGKQSQLFIAKHLRNYDMFIQPSRREGFGLTAAEGLAAGLPVIVASGQGPAEVVKNDKYGWVFDNGDAESLAKCINNVIDNYKLALSKAKEGRDYVRNTYDVSLTAKRYLDLYGTKTIR